MSPSSFSLLKSSLALSRSLGRTYFQQSAARLATATNPPAEKKAVMATYRSKLATYRGQVSELRKLYHAEYFAGDKLKRARKEREKEEALKKTAFDPSSLVGRLAASASQGLQDSKEESKILSEEISQRRATIKEMAAEKREREAQKARRREEQILQALLKEKSSWAASNSAELEVAVARAFDRSTAKRNTRKPFGGEGASDAVASALDEVIVENSDKGREPRS